MNRTDQPRGAFCVNFWGSKPGTSDDCHTGYDFDTLADAVAKFEDDNLGSVYQTCTAYIELDGPGVHRERRHPDFVAELDDCAEWRREQRMQAAMAFGVQGWNDYDGGA